ncbi:MAG: hypothetical protein EOO69_12110 [Moraxellaceae bacterium]|nr:MAG: hypothetical protein EOO69_12110 [Moraxellaceae bacterium]
MKNFYILPLAGAIAALTACTPAPVKQEIIPLPPVPVAQPVVLRKVDPETSAPHYHLNPKNYEQPLNPIIVQEIREALTPKIINPATGEVVTRLPLLVPVDPITASQNTATATTNGNASNVASAPTATDLNAADPLQVTPAPNQATSANTATDPTTAAMTTDSTGAPVAAAQDTQAALLKIDSSLILNDQAVANIAASQNQTAPVINAAVTTPAVAISTANIDTNSTAALDSDILDNKASDSNSAAPAANPVVIPATVANAPAKILIPIHQQQMVKTVGTPAPSNEMLDVTEIDKDITLLEGKARHYPTYFKDKLERWKAEKQIKALTKRLDLMAVDPRASYELLLRAMKSHVLARNMDAGPDSAFKSAVYFQRLLKLKPADPETSFWYGFSLGEGGGFRESIPHLDIAVKADYQEAYLALAHSYLQMEDKKNALTVLNNYKIKYPDDTPQTDQLIAEIQAGKRYSIWQ